MQDNHCAQLVREADKDRFLASLFAPADRRGDLFALYAFNIEIGRVRALAREPLPGEMRLQHPPLLLDAPHDLDVDVYERLIELDYGDWDGLALGDVPPG